MKRFALLALLTGCNGILGIEDLHLGDAGVEPDAAPDAPMAEPNTVVGGSHLTHISFGPDEVKAEDLSGYTIQAYIPDDSEASGFRVVDGAGTADGTFRIENVPDGVTYYLKVVRPDAAGPAFFVTDLHVLDFDRPIGGRADAQSVTLTQTVNVNLTGMQAWKYTDFLVAGSYNTSTEEWNIEQGFTQSPAVGATSLVKSWDWGCNLYCYSYRPDSRPALVDMAKGDTLQIAHARTSQAYDTANQRAQGYWSLVDIFDTATVTMQSGVALSLAGAFTPVTANKTVRFTFNKAVYDVGYETQSTFQDGGMALYGSPGANRSIRVGLPLAGVSFTNFAGPTPASSTIDVSYGDPIPAAWPRIVDTRYTRLRHFKLPGTTIARPQYVGYFRAVAASEAPPAMPDVSPPTGIQVAGAAASAGGRRSFDGVAPVTVSWSAVSTANQYRVFVHRLYVDGTRTRQQTVASLHTRDTSVKVPAEVFAGGEYFAFSVAAVRNGGQLAAGHLRAEGFPVSDATNITGQIRLRASCGDGATQTGEACDPGATETASCDIDCTAPLCGDGIVNVAAGEQCDTVVETPACDADCTLPVCGDGFRNANLEDCDDGNTVDDNNGCSTTCRANNSCGDSVTEHEIEFCDDGNRTDEGNGCSIDCIQNNVCGDGVTQSLFEQCDEGGEGATCDDDCTPVECGDGLINSTAGETCEPPSQDSCDASCHSS